MKERKPAFRDMEGNNSGPENREAYPRQSLESECGQDEAAAGEGGNLGGGLEPCYPAERPSEGAVLI